MKSHIFKLYCSIGLIVTMLVSTGCVWYRDGYHSITIVNHTDRSIFNGNIQFGSLTYWAGGAPAQGEGGDVGLDVKWIPRQASFIWSYDDVLNGPDYELAIDIPPYPDVPWGAEMQISMLGSDEK